MSSGDGARGEALRAALAALDRAGREVLRRYAEQPLLADAPADISTAADRASQEILLRHLHARFPDDSLCAEEATPALALGPAASERQWIVDPIDGTRGFARKTGEFSLMVALVEGGVPVVGAVLEPAADRLTFATRGGGCWLREPVDGEPLRCRVSQRSTPEVLSMSRSRGDAGRERLLAAFGASEALETYSAGIKLAQVARGASDLYLGDYLTLKDWDLCAGHLLVEEAGGRVTDLRGDAVRYDGSGRSLRGRGVLASNGAVHEAALAAVRSAGDLV